MAKKPKSGGQDLPLDPGEAELWEQVTRSAEPLKQAANRAPLREPARGDVRAATARNKPEKKKTVSQAGPIEQPSPAPAPAPAPPPLGGYDRREARGLGTGRISIDGRIDLHGMRQREAHGALKAFIRRARDRGHRHVLVITGKGAPRGSRADEDFFSEPGQTPGVLRRAVPRWLDEPEFRGWVVGFTQAAPRHGGEGALYVRLRRSDRSV